MSLSPSEKLKVAAYVNALPDRHIPPEEHQKIRAVADSISYPVWGRGAQPDQIAALHAQGLMEPQQIHQAFADLPHPHAPNLTLGEWPQYVSAFNVFKDHAK